MKLVKKSRHHATHRPKSSSSKIADNPLLKNVAQLAEALGVSPVFIKRMRWAGFAMPGGKAIIDWALEWLRAHPEFSQSAWTRPRRGV